MKCPNCDGKGVVHVRNIHAICGKCKGFGWIDEPQKKPQTNEEWFCGLSTEEKAEFLVKIELSAMHPIKRGAIDMEKFIEEVVEWLKQPHKE